MAILKQAETALEKLNKFREVLNKILLNKSQGNPLDEGLDAYKVSDELKSGLLKAAESENYVYLSAKLPNLTYDGVSITSVTPSSEGTGPNVVDSSSLITDNLLFVSIVLAGITMPKEMSDTDLETANRLSFKLKDIAVSLAHIMKAN